MAHLELDDRGIVVPCSTCGQNNRVLYERLGGAVKCGRCKTELSATAAPLEVSASVDFDRLISHASIPVVVDYWAPWCGPCRVVAPELAKVAARAHGKFLVVKVNTDALNDLGERFGIRSIPTMAVFSGGREVTRTTGARPAAEIEAFIAQATGLSPEP
jgi:thioredoxin 2